MGYEQMELDVTLTCDRELKDNVGLAVEFACRQIAAQNQKVVESNHEGYGIAAEGKVALDSAMKKVSDDMKLFLRILIEIRIAQPLLVDVFVVHVFSSYQ